MTAAPALVLHDTGDARGGAPWAAALAGAGWPAPVIAPDLPGHGEEPAPEGGHYELADSALFAVRVLARHEAGDGRPVVVGVGLNGWSAQVLALGGRASQLVLVDGLNGPWRDPRAQISAGRDWLRRITDDPDAAAPAPPSGLDPRLRAGLPPHGSRPLAERAAASMPVPALLVETAASPLDPADVADLARGFRSGATVVHLDAPDRGAVAQAIVRWARDLDDATE